MEHNQEDDLIRVKELLNRTGEFIAYFELAETKMVEWRQEIESQAKNMKHQSDQLKKELELVHHLLSETGVANFRSKAEQVLAQGEANLKCFEQNCSQFNNHLQNTQEELNYLTTNSLEKIDKQTTQTTQNIAAALAKYDAQHFNRIATESCDHVERVANNAIIKSNKLLHLFQFRLGFLTVILTVLTAFIIVLYISDESPWEMHNQAMNERQAGKMLLEAWPHLSQLEKENILNHESPHHG